MEFLDKHSSIKFSCDIVKTKVMNEKKERKRKLERMQVSENIYCFRHHWPNLLVISMCNINPMHKDP